MSQFEKLWDRFLLVPSDFTYDELRKIMKHYGYSENNKGKTSGSRVVFIKRDCRKNDNISSQTSWIRCVC